MLYYVKRLNKSHQNFLMKAKDFFNLLNQNIISLKMFLKLKKRKTS